MTFSATKSFVSTMVGLAFDRGLIRSVDDLVHPYMAPVVPASPPALPAEGGVGPFGAQRPIPLFDTEHNRTITWDHLLRQVSDWEGTLWGKPEWADRPSGEPATWATRARNAPGSAYEYNDTRVNVLALAALNVWRRPLPEVLREYVMDPIGATGWEWHGYENSWVTLDGEKVQSVPGGGHWGGGMWISARDQARFGLLHMRHGKWKDRQILSDAYLEMATTPGTLNSGGFGNYGMPGLGEQAAANGPSAGAITHSGNGPNRIFSDPKYDLVIVTRWSNGSEFIQKIIDAIDPATITATGQE